MNREAISSAVSGAAESTIGAGAPTPAGGMRDDGDTRKPGRSARSGLRLGGMSLVTRVFLGNAAVLVAAVAVLVVSPVTVSSPVVLAEAVVLVAGLSAILIVSLVLFRRAFAPLLRLTQVMRTIDLLEPGPRVPVHSQEAEVTELSRAFNEMLDRLEEERRQSAHRSLTAQEDERRRVAQELHDEVGQRLTAVLLQLDRLARAAPESLREDHVEAREATRQTLEEVRKIAQRLRPEALDELGLRNALGALADRAAEQGGVRVVQRLDGRLPLLSGDAELVIYRIAQEGLTNVLRHAAASQVVLTLRGDAEGVTLQVADDGCGIDGVRPGAGIQGMRERALLVGAALEIRNRPQGGTELRLEIPAESE